MSTKEIEVQFLGKSMNFNVPSSIDNRLFMDIVDYVENIFRKVKREPGDLDSFRLGLLVSINIAEEVFSLKEENRQLRAVLTNIDHMIPAPDHEHESPKPIRFSSVQHGGHTDTRENKKE